MQIALPCSDYVYISRKDFPEQAYGTCDKLGRGFEIRLDWSLPWPIIRDHALPHEYAHARVWGRLQAGTKDHDSHFWIEVGVVTEVLEESLPFIK